MNDEDVNGMDDYTDEMFAEEFPVKTFNPFDDELRTMERKCNTKKIEKVREDLNGFVNCELRLTANMRENSRSAERSNECRAEASDCES